MTSQRFIKGLKDQIVPIRSLHYVFKFTPNTDKSVVTIHL